MVKKYLFLSLLIVASSICFSGCRKQTATGKTAQVSTKAPFGTKVNPIDGAEMVFVPAGEFVMGSNDGAGDLRPKHKVYLNGYYIYKTEVTNAQFKKFCNATGWKVPSPSWGRPANHPVVKVTWQDAMAYAKWARVKLPTEAQWEKAARGNDKRTYPWGNNWEAVKCSNSCVIKRPVMSSPVGSFPAGASPYGCLDMAGNVWEWCADLYNEHYYTHAPRKNPAGPKRGSTRVLRGGSWGIKYPSAFSTFTRFNVNPSSRSIFYGFRCVDSRQ